mgnify:CR=1 FL=1
MPVRYNKTKVSKIESTIKKKFDTTIYSKVPERNADIYLISVAGDRCDVLADLYYKDSQYWWFIARVNHLSSNNIPAGTSLRMPATLRHAVGN